MSTALRCAPPTRSARAMARPKLLTLNAEVIACGHAPALEVAPGTATTIATGGVMPRGADAVVMIEHTELVEDGAAAHRAAPRRRARAVHLLCRLRHRARRDVAAHAARASARARSACWRPAGLAEVDVVRRPKVAVLSTGDELVAPGEPLRPAGVYDSNGAIIAAAVAEAGGEPVAFGAFPDDEAALEQAVRDALADMRHGGAVRRHLEGRRRSVASRRVAARQARHPRAWRGAQARQAALPRRRSDGKPIAVLPGFPTSAIFTFHAFVAPVIRARAGLPPEAARNHRGARAGAHRLGDGPQGVRAGVAGRRRAGRGGVSRPAKGSGAVTSFSQADGFIEIDALASALDADSDARVTLIGSAARAPDLVIMGSHDIALDVGGRRAGRARLFRAHARGRQPGRRRGGEPRRMRHRAGASDRSGDRQLQQCICVAPGLSLVPGWRRMQGMLFRPGDERFEGRSAQDALKAALADPSCLMVNRNAGAGTRVLIDTAARRRAAARLRQPAEARTTRSPPRSRRGAPIGASRSSRWREMYGLGFLPVAPEHYDFLLVEKPARAAGGAGVSRRAAR